MIAQRSARSVLSHVEMECNDRSYRLASMSKYLIDCERAPIDFRQSKLIAIADRWSPGDRQATADYWSRPAALIRPPSYAFTCLLWAFLSHFSLLFLFFTLFHLFGRLSNENVEKQKNRDRRRERGLVKSRFLPAFFSHLLPLAFVICYWLSGEKAGWKRRWCRSRDPRRRRRRVDVLASCGVKNARDA